MQQFQTQATVGGQVPNERLPGVSIMHSLPSTGRIILPLDRPLQVRCLMLWGVFDNVMHLGT